VENFILNQVENLAVGQLLDQGLKMINKIKKHYLLIIFVFMLYKEITSIKNKEDIFFILIGVFISLGLSIPSFFLKEK